MKVELIAQTVTDGWAVKDWMNERGYEFSYETGVEEPDTLIELAGRACYNSFDGTDNPNITRTRKGNKVYIDNILDVAHGSVLEHVMFTFAFTGISRVVTHELVRHRAGTAISQESLRYVTGLRERLNGMYCPPEIQEDAELLAQWSIAKEKIIEAYSAFEERTNQLIEGKDFGVKKAISSATRRLCPIGVPTNMVWSCNARTLRFVLQQRTDPAAEIEIRELFNLVWEKVKHYHCMGAETEEVNGLLWIKGGKV